ncbi:hypothetical protein MJI38_10565, partial [Salmonella enterica subsp. enterica serovar Montevideo]|nr:hypothetical protein [Salmonella enterica subsp. enterica serovar Montevideo]
SPSTSTTRNQQHKKERPMPPHKIRQEWLTLDEMTLAQIQYSAKSEIFVFLTLAETSRYKPPPSAIL